MEYCFDSIFVKNGKIFATGWAVSSVTENEIEITVTDEKKTPVDVIVTWAARPDVGLAKYGDPKAGHVGIFLEIPFHGQHLVTVYFKEKNAQGNVISEQSLPLNPALIAARKFLKESKAQYVSTKKSLIWLKKKLTGNEYADYDTWLRIMRVSRQELFAQRKTKFSYAPKFSVVVPLYHTPAKFLKDLVRSMMYQSYANWELCLVNASPEDVHLTSLLENWAMRDKRIRVIRLEKNLGIAQNTNAGIAASTGEFIAFLDHDDFLEPDALFCYADALNKDKTIDVFYSDEDKTDEYAAHYFYPHFKSDFNIDLLHANNYMCHFLAVRKSLVDTVGGLNEKFDGAQDYDFVLRLTENTKKIYHCPRILYHWRCSNQSTAANQGNKMYAIHAGKAALNAHYKRIGWNARAQEGAVDGWYQTKFTLKEEPLVSILIPNKDHTDDLDVCLNSFFERADYQNYEFIIIENNSVLPETFAYYEKIEKEHDNVKVVYWEAGFNYSAINNFGFKFAKGDYIMLLNNDVELITPDIFQSMLGFCMRPEVGIVGAKLLYNDHTVQHAGVLVGAGGLADHVFKGIHEDDPGYMGRAISSQDVSAVTAACLLVKRSVYEEVGGLEDEFQVAFNDVDFCLKVRKAGYLIVYDADVKLFHYESKSRGMEDTTERFIRFGNEMMLLNSKWDILSTFVDPYYNPNLSYLEYYKINHTIKEARKQQLIARGEYSASKK
ncbi:glycosyltransferase family 2 protein [Anthropogastromicrobium aceti]|uniref:Glycosyltransferase family 2 protein n=1 Tax=Anthropogastromicrobium aceti TaxID=2981768 RepID=A0AAE3E3Y6_9FIRM|nr:glycosyltransferase family 2 protein [Anthropogastromicrobium aceti]MCC2221431.1 glycosyltransferase family 2 protein [Anthropogastromicrobium aceti]